RGSALAPRDRHDHRAECDFDRASRIGYAQGRLVRDRAGPGRSGSMIRSAWPRMVMCAAAMLSAGCTTLREIPRGSYAERPARQHVRIVTREGLVYEFDYATVSGDSLTGYRRRDTEGVVDDTATLRIALDDVQRFSARAVDWYRTGLIGGGVLAAVIAKGL